MWMFVCAGLFGGVILWTRHSEHALSLTFYHSLLSLLLYILAL